jgi:hypothetical protein
VKSEAKKFVIQRHTCGNDIHWDLMLESGNALKTWRINASPEHISNEPVNAEKIFDHDLKFLTYEGAVQNSRGKVSIADDGTIETIEETEKIIRLRFNGKILIGEFTLELIDQDRWQLLRT